MIKRLLLLVLTLALAGPAAVAAAAETGRLSDQERILALTAKVMAGQTSATAAHLKELLQKPEPGQIIVSLQPPDEYRRGHVPGARLLPAGPADLAAALKLLPGKDQTYLLVSSNGQDACRVSLVLRQLGYDARQVMLGMNAYNRWHAGTGAYLGDIRGPLETAATEFRPSDSPPPPTYSDLSDEELIRRATEAYAGRNRPFNITAYDLQGLDGAVIISMQSPEDYARGHIPGAINIPGPDFLAGDRRLLQLPRDKKIIVTCYIGHYSSLGAMLLNQLGYEAYSLNWGLAGWNTENMAEPVKGSLIKGLGLPVQQSE